MFIGAATLLLATVQVAAGPSGQIPAQNVGASSPTNMMLGDDGAALQSGKIVTPSDTAANKAALARRAQFTNAMEDYRRYIHDFPDGSSAKAFQAIVDARQAALAELVAHPTKGLRRPEYIVSFDVLSKVDFRELRQIAPTGDSVRLAWDLAEDGQVENCRIVVSSGLDKMDWITCVLITKYLKVSPARDKHGLPTRSMDLRTIHWPH